MSSTVPSRFNELSSLPPLYLAGQALAFDDVVSVALGSRAVMLDQDCARQLLQARVAVMEASKAGEKVYGLTTGVGALKGISVKSDNVRNFNRQLILSHRVSSGAPIATEVVRATILCRAQGLVMGGAGVRPIVIEALLDLLNTHEIPIVYATGSVGQADLAPLAEIAEFSYPERTYPGGARGTCSDWGEFARHWLGRPRA